MLSIILCFSTVGASELFGFNVEYVGKLKVPAKPALLAAWSFCVTEDGLFIIPDKESGDIKIYEKAGETLEYVKAIGRKGFGPGEFVSPAYCSYNEKESKFIVMDLEQRKIFIYDRVGRENFKRVKMIYCFRSGDDVQLIGNKLIISGYKEGPHGADHELYITNIKTGDEDFLLRSFQKYGLSQSEKSKAGSLRQALGVIGRFDVEGDDIYFVWEGDLRITKLNISTKKTQVFGPGVKMKTKYKSPADIVNELLDNRTHGRFHLYRIVKFKRSFVRNVFTSAKYVFVIYEGPGKSKFWLQFYMLNGNFIKEVPIPGQPDRRMCFDKDKGILYSLVSSKSKEKKKDFLILKYKIR